MRKVLAAQQATDLTPLPYTASPLKLMWSDACLFVQSTWAIPGIFLPLVGLTKLDEFYPSLRDGGNIMVHSFLVIYQTAFLMSLPIAIVLMLPTLWIFAYIALALLLNYAICLLTLNGWRRFLVSQVPAAERPGHEREHWIYMNGVAVG